MTKYKYKAEVILEFDEMVKRDKYASTLLEAGAKAVMHGAGSYTKFGGFGDLVIASEPRITVEAIKPRKRR